MIYIKKNSTTHVLAATNDGKVIEEDFLEGKAEQLWTKGTVSDESYFTLESHSQPKKFLTANTESGLEIKGNITLRWMTILHFNLKDTTLSLAILL